MLIFILNCNFSDEVSELIVFLIIFCKLVRTLKPEMYSAALEISHSTFDCGTKFPEKNRRDCLKLKF